MKFIDKLKEYTKSKNKDSSNKNSNTENTNINFVFVRHGYGCHNSIRNLITNNLLNTNEAKLLNTQLIDPELTPIGVTMSIHNGNIINSILKTVNEKVRNDNLKMDEINVIGCSPLIRSMETAYFMSRDWVNPPKKIYVFPLLRELDESSPNKYSKTSLQTIDKIPSYAMKSIIEQKKYLRSIGLLDLFDFSFVEKYPLLRQEPGDISKFIDWFNVNYIPQIEPRPNLNVFIVTHAGVLKDYSNTGFVNNSGFIINGNLQNKKFNIKNKLVSIDSFLPKEFFKEYHESKWNKRSRYCPSNRCGNGKLCKLIDK